MEEHQNNTMQEHQNNTDVQNTQADSDESAPKVIKAGSEAKAGRRVLRGGASNGGEGSDHAAEAARSVVRAGQQAVEGARAATYAVAANSAEASDHATEATRNVVRAGQQAVEGARAATYAAVDESTGGGKVLDEWASFIKRAMERNTQALGDVMHCYTLPSLLQWQNHLLNATITDLWETNSRILQSVTHKA
jgi:hypothetical protein